MCPKDYHRSIEGIIMFINLLALQKAEAYSKFFLKTVELVGLDNAMDYLIIGVTLALHSEFSKCFYSEYKLLVHAV